MTISDTLRYLTDDEARLSFNHGYWDGRADQVKHALPAWSDGYDFAPHPFDFPYGKGYWAGKYEAGKPSTSEAAWDCYARWMATCEGGE